MTNWIQTSRLILASLGLLILLTTACGRAIPEYCEEVDPVTNGTSTPFLLPEIEESAKPPEEIEGIWRDGPHVFTDIQERPDYEPTCDRCHDRMNWDPSHVMPITGGDHSPPDKGGRSASAVANLPDGCLICHPEDRGSAPGAIAWLEDASLGVYSDVQAPEELCAECHLNHDAVGHNELKVTGAHSDFDCTGCHEPHSSEATCTGAGCHPAFTQECEVINTHDKPHQEVSCSGCHDSAGHPIGWNEETGAWDTFRASAQPGEDAVPVTSHEILSEVDCDRCHAPGNHPWGY